MAAENEIHSTRSIVLTTRTPYRLGKEHLQSYASHVQRHQVSGWKWAAQLAALTFATLCIHGFHPLSEDGGLYVAGVKSLLHPELYPKTLPFVREHLRFSLFAPSIAWVVRALHIPLLWTLFVLYLVSVGGTLAAIRALLQRLGFQERSVLCGVLVVAACWTMPVAATSLMLMDPYLTARSLTMPLTLLALAWALDGTPRKLAGSCTLLVLAALLHPLMAFYGAALVFVLVSLRSGHRNKLLATAIILVAAIAISMNLLGPPESPTVVLAVSSRYYCFLSQWHWYEYLGLIGPLAIFAFLRRISAPATQLLAQASIVCGLCSVLCTLAFAQEHLQTHVVALLQPLRVFAELYMLMLAMGAATVASWAASRTSIALRLLPWTLATAAAVGFVFVARMNYGASPQIEVPWRANTNPWAQAFLWARDHTDANSLFALDAKYVNRDGEDAQTFRAIAERDALPDYSKDGGEAAIEPALADTWWKAATAQQNLDAQNDAARDYRLAPYAVDYVILNTSTPTTHPCPYSNVVVKVCSLR